MKKKWILLLLLVLPALPLVAQQVLIEEDLRGDTLIPRFGMNRNHYWHSYLGAHFPNANARDPLADINVGRSWTFEYGFRYKRRFSQILSAGLETYFKRSSFHPENFLDLDIPQGYSYNREKFVFLAVGAAIYQRFNTDPWRGNYIGRFIDVGGYFEVNAGMRHVLHLQGPDRLQMRRKGMGIHEPFQFGLLARFGRNNFVIKGSYRISDLFKPETALPDFPRFTLGLELGLHPL